MIKEKSGFDSLFQEDGTAEYDSLVDEILSDAAEHTEGKEEPEAADEPQEGEPLYEDAGELPALDEEQCLAAIEAILFTMGKAVEVDRLAYAVNLSVERTWDCLHTLREMYEEKRRGISLLFLEKKVQLCTKKEYYAHLIRIASQPKKPVLTDTVIETLSIVAYKQPVTKADIERIRGVKSDFAVNKLVEYGLIEEVGRLDAPGRPILFATSEEFLRRFGVNSIDSLPQANPEQVEEFKTEAEAEIVTV